MQPRGHRQETSTASQPAGALTAFAALDLAESQLREAGRVIEWVAVQCPKLARSAKLAFMTAQHLRGDRLAMVQ